MAAIIECVPNISEGRDLEKIEKIVSAARGIDGCSVLGVEPDADYNRTVITIAGNPESVKEAAYRLIESAIIHIDMRVHSGEHPRLGVVDVCPFIPLEGASMDDCSNYAVEVAKSVSENFLFQLFFMVIQPPMKTDSYSLRLEKKSMKDLKVDLTVVKHHIMRILDIQILVLKNGMKLLQNLAV